MPNHAQPMTNPQEPPLIADRVIQAIQKVKSNAVVTIDSTFESLGVDSLDAIEILFEVEEDFQVSVPTEAVKKMRNVRDVVTGIEQLLASKNPAPATSSPPPAAGSPPPAPGGNQSP
jgi:acyl carrier protein